MDEHLPCCLVRMLRIGVIGGEIWRNGKRMGRLYLCIQQDACLQLQNIFESSMSSRHQFHNDCLFVNISEVQSSIDDHHCPYPQSDMKPCDNPTMDSKCPSLLDFLHSSSLQLGPRNYQTSFEDNFMDQHQNSFKNQIRNFIESSFKSEGNQNITFQSVEILKQDPDFGSLRNEDDLLLNFQNKRVFLMEIQKEEKLQEYFSYVFQTLPKSVASEVVYVSSIAYFAWESKMKDSLSFRSEQEFVGEAKKLAETQAQKLFQDQRIKFLNLKQVQKEELNSEANVMKAFKNLIESLFATVGLIATGFFGNPYQECEEAKRPRSFGLLDDEDQISSSSTDNLMGLPRKRVH